jgi:uncharacterized MnhB-related membrane protein
MKGEMMISAVIYVLAVLFAIMAIRVKRLIASALWLAGVSALLSVAFYRLGAHQVAAIELSVGAGLVTVLFVFAISIAGEDLRAYPSLVPLGLAVALCMMIMAALAWFVLPAETVAIPLPEPPLGTVLYQQRGLDLVVQLVLIFAGTLGLLGLLAEASAPLQYPAAKEAAAARDRELSAMTKQSMGEEAQ